MLKYYCYIPPPISNPQTRTYKSNKGTPESQSQDFGSVLDSATLMNTTYCDFGSTACTVLRTLSTRWGRTTQAQALAIKLSNKLYHSQKSLFLAHAAWV
jgi:hypothetical protein